MGAAPIWCRPAARRASLPGRISIASPSSSIRAPPLRPRIRTEEGSLRSGWLQPGLRMALPQLSPFVPGSEYRAYFRFVLLWGGLADRSECVA